MRFCLALLIAVSIAPALPASAQPPAAAPAAVKQESVAEWHQKLLVKYAGQLIYLDAEGKPMTPAAFLDVVERRIAPGITMTEATVARPNAGVTTGGVTSLTLRVMKAGAASDARAAAISAQRPAPSAAK